MRALRDGLFVLGILLTTTFGLSTRALADCAAAPIGSTDDLVISFLAANGTQVSASSLLTTSVKEGMLVYDITEKTLKLCDGDEWISAGSGTGVAGIDKQVQFNDDGELAGAENMLWFKDDNILDVTGTVATNVLRIKPTSTGSLPPPQGMGGTGSAAGTVTGVLQFRAADGSFAANDTGLVWNDGDARLGIGTDDPQSALQVAGGVQIGDDTATCPGASNEKLGTIRFNTGVVQICLAGGWSGIASGSEVDPKIGTLTNNQWCTSDGSQVICNTAPPVTTELDPKVGAVDAGKWCLGDGDSVECSTDPLIGTLTGGKWCNTDGNTVTCSADLPPAVTALANLTDVSTTGIANGKALVYNSTSAKWEAQTIAGGGTATPVMFSVHRNNVNQSVTAGNYSKISWTTERFDTNNNFDTGTSRFTPTVAGKYLITLHAYCVGTATECDAVIYKNGSNYAQGWSTGSGALTHEVTTIVEMNGTTDYVEGYVWNSTATLSGDTIRTYMVGALLSENSGGGGSATSNQGYVQIAGASGAFADSGTTAGQQLFWDNTSKRLGIGTATPSTPLEVVGTVKAASGLVWSANGSTSTSRSLLLENFDDTANANGVDIGVKLGGSEFQGLSWVKETAWTSASAAADKDAMLQLGVLNDNTPTNRVFIKANGNVGIGVVSPVAKQDVGGGIKVGDQATCIDGTHNGTLRYNSGALQICQSSGWSALGGSVTALDDIGDVSAGSVSSGQVLGWNGSAWVPFSVSLSSQQIPQGSGTAIGTLTSSGGLAAAFDGTVSQNNGSSATTSSSVASAYVGKDFSASPQSVSSVTVYPSNQSFYVGSAAANVTINLRGRNGGAPSSPSNGTLLGTSGSFADTVNPTTITSNDPATPWSYLWIEVIPNVTESVHIAEVQFLQQSASAESQWFSSGGNAYRSSGNVGIGVVSPVAKLEVGGGVKIGDQTTCTDGTHNGTLRYRSNSLELCTTSGWGSLGGGGSSQWTTTGSDIYYNTGNVGVGTTSPAASAKLDVASTSQGFLPPRMTTTQRDAISSPAEGLVVYNSTSKSLEFYNGSAWVAPGSTVFVTNAGSYRTWSNGTYATSCNKYLLPDAGFSYTGATGDGIYRIDPDGAGSNPSFDVYCNMTTDGGGWALVVRANNQGDSSLNTTNAYNGVPTPTGNSSKISHANIQMLVNVSALDNPIKMDFADISVVAYVWKQCSWTSSANRNKCASWASTATATTHVTHCGSGENPSLNNGNGGEWPSNSIPWPYQDGTCQVNGGFNTSGNGCGAGNGDAWCNHSSWAAKTGIGSTARYKVNIWVK